MSSKSQFAALEIMCRERAAVAKREMEYWLAEAEEWKQLRVSTDPSIERSPIQLDWCAELGNQ
jgi:hypothetical protein